MEKKTLGMILKLPAQLILILIAGGALYAKITGIYPMQWATPITIVAIVLLYFIGLYLSKKEGHTGKSESSSKSEPAIISLEPTKEISMPALSPASTALDGVRPRIVRLS